VAAAVGAWILWRRDAAALRGLWSPPGLLAFALIAAAWPAWVFAQGLGPTLMDWWRFEMAGRVDGSYFRVAQPAWYYLFTLSWQMLPWTPFLLLGAWPALREAWRDRDSGWRFCWCWAAAPILLLSIPPHKHHHYIIHALPGLAPVAALGLVQAGRRVAVLSAGARRRLGVALLGGGVALALAAVLAAPPILPAAAAAYAAEIAAYGAILGAGLAALGLALGVGPGPGMRWPARAAGACFATALALYIALHAPFLPDRDLSGPDRLFLREVAARLPPYARLIVTGRQPLARHLFYLDAPGRRAEGVWVPEQVARRLRPGETVYVVTRAEDAPALARAAVVERIAVSRYTRSERRASDRYTLFRLTAR